MVDAKSAGGPGRTQTLKQVRMRGRESQFPFANPEPAARSSSSTEVRLQQKTLKQQALEDT